jgi:hypothetical protein
MLLRRLLCVLVIVFFIAPSSRFRPADLPALSPSAPSSSHLFGQDLQADFLQAYGNLPLSFEPNLGQIGTSADFVARGDGYSLSLTGGDAVFTLQQPTASATQSDAQPFRSTHDPNANWITERATLRMHLVDATPRPQVAGLEELSGKTNYIIGNESTHWRTNIPTYGRVMYREVLPGVDLMYYGNQRQLEYDFLLAPGANVASIRLAFDGADSFEVDAEGELVLHVADSEVRHRRPHAYQPTGDTQQEVASRYVLTSAGEVGFELGPYDASQPLVIDPVLVYSTFLGGSVLDGADAIAVDSTGAVYVAGFTLSTNFPTVAEVVDTTSNGARDAFVTKLNPSGSAVVYSTYLGGSTDECYGGCFIAIDSTGAAYLTGMTASSNFPTTTGAYDTTLACGNFGCSDTFIAKIDPSGSTLVYSSFLGGSNDEDPRGIAVDSDGAAYITGRVYSSNFPTTAGSFDRTWGGSCCPFVTDAFVTKLNPAGSALIYSTFLGGSNQDGASGIVVDATGSAYIIGSTSSSDFPTTPGAFDRNIGPIGKAFITKLDPSGTSLLYSTFLGGSQGEEGRAIAVDATGAAYVAGWTLSANFPLTAGAPDQTFGFREGFVTKLNPAGSALVYSTFLGGSSEDVVTGIAVDSTGSSLVTGYTASANFPLTSDALRTSTASWEGFVTKIDSSGSTFTFSTFLGGNAVDCYDRGCAITVDATGAAYVTGSTSSSNFPTTPGAHDQSHNGPSSGIGGDAFVLKLAFSTGQVATKLAFFQQPPDSAAAGVAFATQPIITVQDATGQPVSNDSSTEVTLDTALGSSGKLSCDSLKVKAQAGEAKFTGCKVAQAGTYTLRASATGLTSAESEAVTVSPIANVTLTSASMSSAVGMVQKITATVIDSNNTLLAETPVSFTLSGANLQSRVALTGRSETYKPELKLGQATFFYRGKNTGVDSITASAIVEGKQIISGPISVTWTSAPSNDYILPVYIFKQSDPAWQNDSYGQDIPGNAADIYEFGCFMTDWAMAMNFAGTKYGFTSDPSELNGWLRDSSNKGYIYNNVNADQIPSYFAQKKSSLPIVKHMNLFGSNNDQQLQDLIVGKGIPVDLRVQNAGGTEHHVLAVGVTYRPDGTRDWYINDPLGNHSTLSAGYPNGYDRMQWLEVVSAEDQTGTLSINLASPAELLVTDLTGRKTGIDPRSGIVYNEIPNATYSTQALADESEAGGPSHPVKTFYSSAPGDGTYTVQIIGTGNGSYTLTAIGHDRQGKSTVAARSGTAALASVDSARVDYSSAPGSSVNIVVDATPPITSAAVSSSGNPAGWYNTDLTVTLSASDVLSGVAKTEYNLDGAGWTIYGRPIPITAEGSYTLQYRSVDKASNQEVDKDLLVKLDKTKPTVTYSSHPASYTADQKVTFSCTAADQPNLSGLNSATCQNIDAPAYSFQLGTNTISATATDKAGNVGSGSTTFTVTTDAATLDRLIDQFLPTPPNTNGDRQQLKSHIGKKTFESKVQANAAAQAAPSTKQQPLTYEQAQILIRLHKALYGF